MGASAREIERQIKETRDRMDQNLTQLEGQAASSATRYGKFAAAGLAAVLVAGAGWLIWRRMHRPTLRDRLGDLSLDHLRDLADELSGHLKERLPSVTVRVNEKTEREPGTMGAILRKVAPALVGTASTAVLQRVARSDDEAYAAPQAD